MTDEPVEGDPLLPLAKAVADGSDVDWNTAESTADTVAARNAIEQLRVVAEVANLHRDPAAKRSTPPRPLVLESWGPLEIRREIGRGRFGTVYLAWDPTLEREVALKILPAANGTAAVIQEARMLARVRHPNVVTVYSVDQFDGAVGLRMEYVAGQSLKQILTARGTLGPHEATLIGIDLSRAVAAVHKAGLLHRDIKVHNVMRESTGRIVLMDFGAGEIRADHSHWLRQIAGTPLYLAPEVFEGKPATIASDIYSLGVVLYHLVTLTYPVPGDTVDAMAAAHEKGAIPLCDVRPDLPSGFLRVIGRALERDPARRYRSVGAMQEDLASALELEIAPPMATRGTAAGQGGATPSVAVLPFVNLGPDQNIEYFCSGLAEDLLTGLGKVAGLRVSSRMSAISALQTTTDVRAICRQLDVGAVLEGTVRKAGDRLRITAQLVSAKDGCHLWSEGYNRQMSDVLTVQEEIAQSVVDRLKVTLTEFPRQPVIQLHTDNPRAYHFYLKGRFYWSRRYHGGLMMALQCFERAIEEDAGYALAHSGVADAHAFLGFYSLQPPRAAFALASEAARRALEIEPDLPEAHTSLALIRLGNDWNWPAAEAEFRRALELDPKQALPRIYLSWLLILRGNAADGLAEARLAQDIEPLSPLVNSGAGYALFLARRYDEAIAECEKSLEVDPNLIVPMYVIGMCLALQSRVPEAIELMVRAVDMSNRAPFYLGLLGNLYARTGETTKVNAILNELDRLAKHHYVPPHAVAYVYAGQNDVDRAVEWEARAFDQGASPFNYFSPIIENIHDDPRHAAELRRMGLKA